MSKKSHTLMNRYCIQNGEYERFQEAQYSRIGINIIDIPIYISKFVVQRTHQAMKKILLLWQFSWVTKSKS